MVEFSLLLPVFAMLALGMITAGIAFNRKLDVAHATREGARYGATLATAQCVPTSGCGGLTWAGLVQSITAQRSFGDVTTTQVCVALVTGNPGTVYNANAQYTTKSDGTPCFDDGNADSGLRVQVAGTRTGDKIEGLFFRIPVTIRSQATTKYEQ